MKLTARKLEKGLPESADEHGLKPPFKNLKRILNTTVALCVSVAALLATGHSKTILTILILLYYAIKTLKRMARTSKQSSKTKKYTPPHNILFVAALFLPADIRDAALGDIEEIYRKDVKRFGSKKAKYLMCVDIFRSNYPKLKYLARSIIIKAMKAVGVYELYRRFTG